MFEESITNSICDYYKFHFYSNGCQSDKKQAAKILEANCGEIPW